MKSVSNNNHVIFNLEFWGFLLSPVLAFLSTSNNLFWPNAHILGFVLADLYWFWGLAFLTALFGYFLQKRSSGWFIVYFLIGPAIWLTFSLLDMHAHYHVVLILHLLLVLSLFVLGIFLLKRPVLKQKILNYSGYFAAFLLITELARLTWGLVYFQQIQHSLAEQGQEQQSATTDSVYGQKKLLPNIYHFIFDEYQTDYFQGLITADTYREFSGFYFFADHRAVYGRTSMSLASLFSGREMREDEGQLNYLKSGINGSESLLKQLKDQTYYLEGVYYGIHPFAYEHFDEGKKLKEYLTKSELRGHFLSDFREIWLTRSLPVLALLLLDEQRLQALISSNFLSGKAPYWSQFVIQKILKKEQLRSANGRYVFVHVVLPHFPHVLNEKCEFFPNGGLGPLPQSACSNRLILDFIAELKRLKRFESSMLIFQSDHGGFHDLQRPKHVVTEKEMYSDQSAQQRSRALLLIKPSARGDLEPMQIRNDALAITDLSQLIKMSISSEDPALIFKNWLNIDRTRAVRNFYFYKKESAHEWSRRLTKYVIEPVPPQPSQKAEWSTAAKVKKAGEVLLRNNPKF